MPIAGAALYQHEGVADLWGAATIPEYRGRGAQGALMVRRINDAAAVGCRWLVSETVEETAENPNPSYHNMLRLGFEIAYLRPNYVRA